VNLKSIKKLATIFIGNEGKQNSETDTGIQTVGANRPWTPKQWREVKYMCGVWNPALS
jgi:hypothetical protein